jgi:hypothetical protein
MDRQFISADTLRDIEFRVSLLRVACIGQVSPPRIEELEMLTQIGPQALVPRQ